MIDAPQATAPEGGIPPELAQLLMGGAGAGEAAPPEPNPAKADNVDPLEHLRASIEHAQAALVSEPDDQDSQLLSKLISGLYQILANRQKEQQAAMGTTPAMKAMSRL